MSKALSKRDTKIRAHIRLGLEDHMSSLGFRTPRSRMGGNTEPEITRRNPTRGRIAYGETVLASDLESEDCHARLMALSKRRTRSRSTILFFIGVLETDQEDIEELLEKLGVRSAAGHGGHVHVVPIAAPSTARART